jgi:hypothetical protein
MSLNLKKVPKIFRILFKIALVFLAIFTVVFISCVCKYGFSKTVNKIWSLTNSMYAYVKQNTIYLIKDIKGQNNIYRNLNKEIETTEYYINNILINDVDLKKIDNENDVKVVIKTGAVDRFVDYPKGYYINLPTNLNYDFSLSQKYVKASNDDIQITISKEWSPYIDVWGYIDYYQNRFFLSEEYQKANNIILHENTKTKINGYETQVISISRNTDSDLVPFNTYTYV